MPSQSEESAPIPGSPVEFGVPPQPEESAVISESPATSINSDAHPLSGQTVPSQAVTSGQSPFWRNASSRIANICGVLGLLLAVTFGITQWVAQDKSIAIAKESELVTLALSCSDEEIKHTSVCQQFLEKYPNGPAISRREVASADYSHQNDSGVEVHITIEGIAVRLAMMDQFLQKQNNRFQSALKISDPGLSLAKMEDIIEGERFFPQHVASSKTALAHQRADNADPSLVVVVARLCMVMTGLLIRVGKLLVPIIVSICALLGFILILMHVEMLILAGRGNTAVLLSLVVYIVEPILFWILRGPRPRPRVSG